MPIPAAAPIVTPEQVLSDPLVHEAGAAVVFEPLLEFPETCTGVPTFNPLTIGAVLELQQLPELPTRQQKVAVTGSHG